MCDGAARRDDRRGRHPGPAVARGDGPAGRTRQRCGDGGRCRAAMPGSRARVGPVAQGPGAVATLLVDRGSGGVGRRAPSRVEHCRQRNPEGRLMCGIVGVARCGSGSPLSEPALVRMRDVLRHRGPDDAGTFRADGIALGSRRLAILDTSPAGRMPMATSDGRYWIAYNGEVYNFRELREVVEQHGQAIHSGTDTEVLLNLYALEGPAFLDRLDGMFALAIWDVAERALFLARDRLGIKPLYYHHSGDGTLTFASEEKALFSAGVHSAFDGDCWEELLCFRHVAGERTPFVDVKRLLPGH